MAAARAALAKVVVVRLAAWAAAWAAAKAAATVGLLGEGEE